MLGKSKVSSLGEFSWTMATPPTIALEKIKSIAGVAISDSMALTTFLDVKAYKNGKYSGYLIKTNTPIDTSAVGDSESIFVYCDRAITIKGTSVDTNTYNGFTYKYTGIYNLTLKKRIE